MRAAKVDRNQADIVDALRRIGATVKFHCIPLVMESLTCWSDIGWRRSCSRPKGRDEAAISSRFMPTVIRSYGTAHGKAARVRNEAG